MDPMEAVVAATSGSQQEKRSQLNRKHFTNYTVLDQNELLCQAGDLR